MGSDAMIDIVKYLRGLRFSSADSNINAAVVNGKLDEAADEIERLRGALQAVVDAHGTGMGIGAQGAGSWMDKVYKALKGNE